MEKKLCALTFDDGPSLDTTPLILEKLRKYGVVASFFVVGDNIDRDSEHFVREASEMGCEICNHSRTHSAMPELSAEEIRAEIEFTSAEIKRLTEKAPKFFRPPYIALDEKMFESIDLTFIAGIGAEDWLPEVTARERAERILSSIKDGAVILLHDMVGNAPTAEALDIIIPALKEEYEFVTVSKLFELSGTTPEKGVIYSFVPQEKDYGKD